MGYDRIYGRYVPQYNISDFFLSVLKNLIKPKFVNLYYTRAQLLAFS